MKRSLSTSALGHLGPEDSLLCPVGCGAVSLASACWTPVAPLRVVPIWMPPDIAPCPSGVEVTQSLVCRNLENNLGRDLPESLHFPMRFEAFELVGLPGLPWRSLMRPLGGSTPVTWRGACWLWRACLPLSTRPCVSLCSSILAGGCVMIEVGLEASLPHFKLPQESWTITEWRFYLSVPLP